MFCMVILLPVPWFNYSDWELVISHSELRPAAEQSRFSLGEPTTNPRHCRYNSLLIGTGDMRPIGCQVSQACT